MCPIILFYTGTEVDSVGDLRDLGINVDPYGEHDELRNDDCLCVVNVPDLLLAEFNSRWKRNLGFADFAQVGPDGKTWMEGYDINHIQDGVNYLSRSDKRDPMSWEDFLQLVKTGLIKL